MDIINASLLNIFKNILSFSIQMTLVISVTSFLPFSFIVECLSSHVVSCFTLEIISVKRFYFCVKIQCLIA